MRVALLVTHLLGTGHLKRSSLLADGFTQAGHEAIVLSGGFPAPNASPNLATLIQLSPVRSDAQFSALYGEDGSKIGAALLAQRKIEIVEALTGFSPDILITELFPFGRRKLAAEFEAAIDAAGDALIYSSVRDILQYPRKAGRAGEAEARFAKHYDGAFVHGDRALAPLEDSWPVPPELATKLHYTGYIIENQRGDHASMAETGEVIVAAGGGSVGDTLFDAAADAGDETWRLLVGGHDRDDRIARLKARGGDTDIEATRPDFTALLGNADLAILQCGYNTAMDVIQSGVRALFVPFEGDGETEQLTRARAFVEKFGCGLIREQDLNVSKLAEEVARLRRSPKPNYAGVSCDGIAQTIARAEEVIRGRM